MQPDVISTTLAVGVLLAMFTSILAWQSKGRFDALQREIVGVKGDMAGLKSDMTGLKSELKNEIGGVRTEVAELKTELKYDYAQIRTELVSIHATIAQIALAVGPQPHPQTG